MAVIIVYYDIDIVRKRALFELKSIPLAFNEIVLWIFCSFGEKGKHVKRVFVIAGHLQNKINITGIITL